MSTLPARPARVSAAAALALAAGAVALPLCAGAAQTLPAGAAAALHWRLVGPFRGGRTLAVAGIPGDPGTFYFGAVDGGVWKSGNAGLTWTPLTDGQPFASIGALALAPSNPGVIYVGTGEADMRSDLASGSGVYRSTDGGATWTALGLADSRQVAKIVVDPRNPDVVLVAALGHAYDPNETRGVFRSEDGGRTWTRVLYQDANTGAVDLAFDPADADTVYAALWQVRRPPWSQYAPDEGPGSGIWRSTDNGRTWARVAGRGLPAGGLGRVGLAVARSGAGLRIYALVEGHAGAGAGLYRSDDGGASWRLVGTDPRITARGWYFGQVFVDPANPDVVYVPDVALLRSADGGATWTAIKGAPGGDDYHALWIDPREPARMILGSDQGASVTLDGGATWSSWYNQPTAQFYHVAVDDVFPYRLYGAQQDAGTVEIASRGDYGAISFRDWHPVGAGESGYLAPDPLDPGITYGGDTYGGVHRFDARTGQSQDISPAPEADFSTPAPERRLRFTWTSPLVFDPRDSRTLYFGAQLLLATRDGGLHWDPVSPDLTWAGAPPAADSVTHRGWGVIYTVAPSPVREGVIWAGTDDGRIQLTVDGGAHWRDVTPPGLAPWSKVTLIEASPFDSATAWAAVDRHRLGDDAPYIYRTRDFGANWTRADTGIAPGAFVHVVRADPARRGLLFAGTETGVYVSWTDGGRWVPLQLNLPLASVRDLAVHDGDLVAATHGRAFWILDDVAPLEALDTATNAVRLFPPRPAVRVRRNVGNDTPLPAEVPQGENPPDGAIIDYFLPAAPAGPVTLEIRDAAGHLVRRFSSADSSPPRPEPPQFTDDWLPRVQPLPARAGLDRFVWDLRYPTPPADRYDWSIAAAAGAGTVAEPQGPLVAPGTYRVTLTAAAETLAVPLEVRPDPRSAADSATYARQLALAADVWNAMSDRRALRDAVDRLDRTLAEIPAARLDSAAAPLVGALRHRLAALRRAVDGAALDGLLTVVESADREPSAAAAAAAQAARQRLDAAARTWSNLVARDLAELNARLAARGAAHVRAPDAAAPHLVISTPTP